MNVHRERTLKVTAHLERDLSECRRKLEEVERDRDIARTASMKNCLIGDELRGSLDLERERIASLEGEAEIAQRTIEALEKDAGRWNMHIRLLRRKHDEKSIQQTIDAIDEAMKEMIDADSGIAERHRLSINNNLRAALADARADTMEQITQALGEHIDTPVEQIVEQILRLRAIARREADSEAAARADEHARCVRLLEVKKEQFRLRPSIEEGIDYSIEMLESNPPKGEPTC